MKVTADYTMVKPQEGTPLIGANNVERNHGAHYYAFSKEVDFKQYTEVMANILLPTDIVWSGGGKTRNAYISLGIADWNGSFLHSCDMGLQNIGGAGWRLCYGGTVNPGTSPLGPIFPRETVRVILIAKNDSTYISSTLSRMILYAQCLDKNNNPITQSDGKNFIYCTFEVEHHNWNRYYRFVSFLHNGDNSLTDGTRMMGTQLSSLGMYNAKTGTYESWGIPTSFLENCWIVGYPHGSFSDGSTTATSETFNINN